VLLTHGAEKKNRADAEWERPDNTPVSEGHTHGDMANVWLGVAGGEEVQSDKGPASLQKCDYEKLWPWIGEGGGTSAMTDLMAIYGPHESTDALSRGSIHRQTLVARSFSARTLSMARPIRACQVHAYPIV